MDTMGRKSGGRALPFQAISNMRPVLYCTLIGECWQSLLAHIWTHGIVSVLGGFGRIAEDPIAEDAIDEYPIGE